MSRRSKHRQHQVERIPETQQPVDQPSVFQRMIVWLFHVLVITTPLFFTFTTDELFEFNKMMLIYVYTVLIAAVWIGRMISEKRFIWRHTKLDFLIGFFLLSQLLSTVFSIHPYTSWLGYYSRFHGGFVSLVTYALLYWAFISNVTKRDLRALSLSTMLAAGVVGIYAIGEHFGHSFSCYMTSGGTSFGADCWVQDVQHRVFATFGQPNWLAAYVLMLLSVLIGLLLSRWPTRWERVVYGICYILLLHTLLYTRSRSGFLGFILALMVIGVGYGVVWWHASNKVVTAATLLQKPQTFWQALLSKSFGVLVGYTAGIILFSGSPYTPSLREIISQKTPDTDRTTVAEPAVVNRLDVGGTDSGEIRKIVWQGALDVWKRYPVLGSGVETFAYSYYQDRPVAHNMVSEWDFLYNKAHNEFFNFLATTGSLGLLAYLSLICGYMWLAVTGFFRLVKEKKYDDARVILAMAGAVAGLSVSNFFGFSTVVVTVLQYLAFAVTMLLLIEPSSEFKHPKSVSAWQLSLMGLTAIAALFPLKGILDHYRADQLYTAGKGLMTQGDIQGAALKLTTAIRLSPRESLFWDELSQLYAQAAVSYAESSETVERAKPLAVEAVAASDQAMMLNNRQLNQYKTRARMFIILSQLDETYVNEAIQTLEQAALLSPTDPKLLYNLGILKFQQGDAVSGFALLEKAVAFKPNYATAATELIRHSWAAGKKEAAVTQLKELMVYEPASVDLQNLLASYSAELDSK